MLSITSSEVCIPLNLASIYLQNAWLNMQCIVMKYTEFSVQNVQTDLKCAL